MFCLKKQVFNLQKVSKSAIPNTIKYISQKLLLGTYQHKDCPNFWTLPK